MTIKRRLIPFINLRLGCWQTNLTLKQFIQLIDHFTNCLTKVSQLSFKSSQVRFLGSNSNSKCFQVRVSVHDSKLKIFSSFFKSSRVLSSFNQNIHKYSNLKSSKKIGKAWKTEFLQIFRHKKAQLVLGKTFELSRVRVQKPNSKKLDSKIT